VLLVEESARQCTFNMAVVAVFIPYIVTGAQILGGINSGLSLIDKFQHKPDPTKTILRAIERAEAIILDAIHYETFSAHVLRVQSADTWWRTQAWDQITTCMKLFIFRRLYANPS
jgi:hypothetical protein